MTTPMLSALRGLFPDSETTLGCREYVLPLFEGNNDVEISVTWSRKGGIAAAVSALRRFRPDRGWDACFVLPASFSSAIVALVSGARARIGYSSGGRAPLLTHPRDARKIKDEHLSVSYVRLVELYSGTNVEEPAAPKLKAPEPCGEVAGKAALGGKYFVLAPGATFGSAKMWPVDRYSALARMITDRTGWKVAVVGSESEAGAGNIILNASGRTGNNLAGRLTVRELMCVINGAELLVGNDSGPAHISAALGRPTVAIFGSTSPGWTSPSGMKTAVVYSNPECGPCFRKNCPDGDAKCMSVTTVDRVFEAVSSLCAGCGFTKDTEE